MLRNSRADVLDMYRHLHEWRMYVPVPGSEVIGHLLGDKKRVRGLKLTLYRTETYG